MGGDDKWIEVINKRVSLRIRMNGRGQPLTHKGNNAETLSLKGRRPKGIVVRNRLLRR